MSRSEARLGATLKAAANPVYEHRARILGDVWAVKVLCGLGQQGGFEALRAFYDPAIRHDQIKVFYNSFGEPIGYIVWAWLAPDVETAYMTTGRLNLHLSEWSEGESLWVLDAAVARGYVSDVIELALAQLFRGQPHARLARRGRGVNALLRFKQLDVEVFRRAIRLLRLGG